MVQLQNLMVESSFNAAVAMGRTRELEAKARVQIEQFASYAQKVWEERPCVLWTSWEGGDLVLNASAHIPQYGGSRGGNFTVRVSQNGTITVSDYYQWSDQRLIPDAIEELAFEESNVAPIIKTIEDLEVALWSIL